jgi:2-oxoglutarate ferredoxin oxidoreductase subunit alpha
MQGKRGKNVINSFDLLPEGLEKMNQKLWSKYPAIERDEVRFEAINTDDAEYIFVAYGTVARIIKTVIKQLRAEGIKVGLFRPISLYPFPTNQLFDLANKPNLKFFMDVEMSFGQMIEDVRLATQFKKPINFYGRQGGMVPEPQEIIDSFKNYMKEAK